MPTLVRVLVQAAVAGGTARSIYQAHRVWRNSRRTLIPPPDPPSVTERVSVLMPARDEAHRIAPGIRSLVAQRGVEDLEILVLDDNSTDGTADVVRAAAGGDSRVRILTGRPLPAGWRGKPHACAQLAEAATGDVLVFVDADVTFAPHAIASAHALLRGRHLDWISPYPRQLTGSLAEYLLQPLTAWTRLSMVDMRHAEDSHEHGSLLANGQFIVVTAAAYERAGGHAVIPDAVIDDLWLASVLKATGSRGVAVEGSALAECRMYDGWSDLRDGYARWIWILFPTRTRLARSLLQIVFSELLPPLAALRGSKVGMVGYAAAIAGRVVSGRAAGDRIFPWVFFSPVTAAISGGMYVYSLRRAAQGGLTWKGRPIT